MVVFCYYNQIFDYFPLLVALFSLDFLGNFLKLIIFAFFYHSQNFRPKNAIKWGKCLEALEVNVIILIFGTINTSANNDNEVKHYPTELELKKNYSVKKISEKYIYFCVLCFIAQ